MTKISELEKLIKVIKDLRHPQNGCPWDLKQTHKSLLKYMIEESYEFIYATEEDNTKYMEEELGDVLLQVLLHAQIADDNNSFNLESVARVLKEKMIRRHPHVFENNDSTLSPEDVVTNWESIKAQEKNEQELKESESLIANSYLQFPSLYSSYKIGKKTSKINFDWDNYQQVLDIVEEEWKEFKDEVKVENNLEKTQEEYGDLLFSMAQLGRHLGFNPEDSLRLANKKFLRRFQSMEKKISEDHKLIKDMNQLQMDVYWDKVKDDENS